MIQHQDVLFNPEVAEGFDYIIGVDEVGRGPLIGDVVTAAVILPADCSLPLNDSKKLSEKKRQHLSLEIKQQAIAYAICKASPEEIDELNILHATMLAMQRAIIAVAQQVSGNIKVLVDGNRCPKVEFSCEAIVKGDAKVAEISAASILAKVHRDQQMLDLDVLYPEYGFAQHKGYPTVKHLAAIKEFGMISGYRKSFKPIRELLNQS
ncbi:MAG: ribonuclease HII [Thiotrichales bacterium]|nr:ribonuclease HII [Thiotrichales bacterium]